MVHDFRKFPELSNEEMQYYYFDSPHKQITSDFRAEVVKVIDGDTVRLRWTERDFDFPLRMLNISARELKEKPERDTSMQMSSSGLESKMWLKDLVLGKEVEIKINPKKRVDKFGRLLGYLFLGFIDVGEESIREGHSVNFNRRFEGIIPNFKEAKIE